MHPAKIFSKVLSAVNEELKGLKHGGRRDPAGDQHLRGLSGAFVQGDVDIAAGIVVFSDHDLCRFGDGDLFAIGGNHFIHAARRNVDIKVICANNFNYGMTGGQYGPTTPLGSWTTTTPYGNIEHPFNLVHLAAASGAVYVARWTALQVRRLKSSIKKALQKEGFSLVEVISPCPEIFDRYNKLGTAVDVMKWFKLVSQVKHAYDPAKAEVTKNKIIVGEFVDIEKPSYGRLLRKMTAKVQKKLKEKN